jgi:HlyD family secretion protein
MKERICYLVLLGLLSCNEKIPNTKPVTGIITESVYAAGVIKSKNQYQVYSTVTGIINKIVVTENDEVRKGDPLILVVDETSKLNSKNAKEASAYADLSQNKEKLTDLKNTIGLAQNKYSSDSLIFKRQQNLWSQGIGTQNELEQKELASQNSKTALESAKIRYNNLLRELQFNAGQSRNNLAITKYKESDYIIKSEISGRVYSLLKEEGEIVNPQTPLAVIGDSTDFLLELQIDEYDIVKIKTGQLVIVTMDSYKKDVFEATITKINPLMNQNTRTFSVEARFIKQPPVLYPNLTLEANIIIREKKNVLIIPRNYLIDDSLVLVGKNKTRLVATGLKDYQKVEITGGLTGNDIIYKPAQ